MPVFRNVPIIRRSRRLSKRPPPDPEFEDLDGFELAYPDDFSPTSPVDTLPAVPLPVPPRTTISLAEISSPALAAYHEEQHEDVTFAPLARSAHARKRKEGHIPRPSNAFMIFRSDMCKREKIKPTVERDHRQISRMAGRMWNQMNEEKRAPFKRAAEREKKRHHELYPDYKYAPVYRTKGGKRKTKRDLDLEEKRCKALADLMYAGVVGNALEVAAQQLDADYAASSIPSSSRRAPSASRATHASTSRRVASRRVADTTQTARRSPAPEPLSPVVKSERMPTPDLSCEAPATESEPRVEPEWVHTSDIPHLSLSAVSDQKPIKIEHSFPSYLPPELDPTVVEPMFSGVAPAIVPMDDLILGMYSTGNTTKSSISPMLSPFSFSPLSTYSSFSDPESADSEFYRSPEVQFTNPFAASTSSAGQQGSLFENDDIPPHADIFDEWTQPDAEWPASPSQL